MTRTIKCYPKSTTAQTQYWEINSDDETYMYDLLTRYLADMVELATHSVHSRDQLLTKIDQFPRGRRGLNSIGSTIGGIVSAKKQNPKKNLSTPQLDALDIIFEIIAETYSAHESPPDTVILNRSLLTF